MGRQHQAHGVILHVGCDRHFADQALQFHQRGPGENLVHLGLRAFGGAVENLSQFRRAGIIDQQFEKEAVELRLRQRVGSFLVDGILCRQHEERFGQSPDLAGGGDLFLLHGLEQRRLRLGRRAIDFVGENNVGENGAALELKLPAAIRILDHQVGAQDVGRHQVGRELDAIEGEVEHFAQCAHEQGLAEAGHTFEQHVPAGKDGDEGALDNFVVADDDFADLRPQRGVGPAKRLDLFFRAHSVDAGGGWRVAGCLETRACHKWRLTEESNRVISRSRCRVCGNPHPAHW